MLKAMVYDFDGTLTPEVMPEFKVLEKSGMQDGARNPEFFGAARTLATEKSIDIYEAMILVILGTMRQAGLRLTDENIALGAGQRIYNPGVEEFLKGLRKQGVANYLLSSGLQAYLKYLKIAPEFAGIYASILSYNQNGEVNGIVRVMSAEEKAVALQEIAMEVNGKSDDFSGIVYVGDGPTDVEAMKHIKRHGGGAILIRHDDSSLDLPSVNAEEVDLVTEGDFTQGGELANYVNSLISA